MTEKINIELGSVQETLLLPLWGRAVETQKSAPKLADRKAVEIINKIDYDFSTIRKNISWVSRFAWVARALHVDRTIVTFIQRNPKATIVNIGCGLDTTFERVDNGQIFFYDLDLPDVIDLRKNFFEETERRKTIPISFFDSKWFPKVRIDHGVLLLAAGVFYYFDEIRIKDFFITVAKNFPGCELFFDIASPLGVSIANKRVIRDGGMDETALLHWGVKNATAMEKWDYRIRLVNEFPLFKGMKKGLPLKMKYGLWISDFLKIMSMVHLKLG